MRLVSAGNSRTGSLRMCRAADLRRESVRMRVFSGYMLLQGFAGASWWMCLVWIPSSRDYFTPQGAPDWTILSFWLADSLLFVVGSVLSGVFLLRGSSYARPVLWFTAGAVSYASLYCVGQSTLTGSAWLAAVAMLPAMCVTLWISVRYEILCRQ